MPEMPPKITFEDGAAYERMMGTWSRLTGEVFLDWLAPEPGLRWIDIGCGNGAFTELVVGRCQPGEVQGIDPSEGQLAFAHTRPASRAAEFRQGDAMALPFANSYFDAAVMALVIFFVPDPARGVAEMLRVVAPGGTAAAYAWDILGGGSPLEPIQAEMRALGLSPLLAPQAAVAGMDALRELWVDAGFDDVETREIVVQRTFPDFGTFWSASQASSVGQVVSALPAADVRRLQAAVRDRLPADAAGRVTYAARANAVKGRVPTGAPVGN